MVNGLIVAFCDHAWQKDRLLKTQHECKYGDLFFCGLETLFFQTIIVGH